MKINALHKRRISLMTSSHPDIISHWAFNGNANDSVGNNHGIASGVTYPMVNGIQMADFSASYYDDIVVPDDASLSFGSADFSIDFLLFFDGINNCWIISKRTNVADDREYWCDYNNGTIRMILVDQANSALRYKTANFTPSTGVIYHIGCTYINEVITIYQDGTDINGTVTDNSGYVNMQNLPEPVRFGRAKDSSNLSLNGKIGVTTFWRKGLTPAEMADVANKKLSGISIL